MINIIQVGAQYQIRFPYDEQLIDMIKDTPGRAWNPEGKYWSLPSARLGFFLAKIQGTPYESQLYIQSNEDLGVNDTVDPSKFIPDYDISDYKFLIAEGSTPFNHQIDALKYSAYRYSHGLQSGFLLADAPGAGKTVEILNIANYMREHKQIHRCLIIVCVNSAKYNWVEDIEKHTNGQAHPYILGSRIKKRKGGIRYGDSKEKYEDLRDMTMLQDPDKPLPFFNVINIEALRYREGKTFLIVQRLIELIKSHQIDFIAIDEVHLNTGMSSQQGKNLLAIKKATQNCSCYWIPMTGTPIVSKPLDVFLPLRLVDGHTQNAFYMWKQDYCVYGGFCDKEVVAYKNIPQLKSILQPNMLRRLKEEILDLPPKIHFTKYVENTAYQQKLYQHVIAEMAELREKGLLSKAKMGPEIMRLRQVNGSPELIDKTLQIDNSYMSKNARLQMLMYLLDEIISNDQKVIVFSNWVEPLRTLHRFIKTKYKVCCFTGTMKEEDRQLHKKTFIENPEYKIMLGTVGALGTSHTLTVARNVIFYDIPWNPATIEQCEDRCHRPGTTQSVNVYEIVTKDTVDELVHNILNKKEGTAKYIVDNELDILNYPELLDMLM